MNGDFSTVFYLKAMRGKSLPSYSNDGKYAFYSVPHGNKSVIVTVDRVSNKYKAEFKEQANA